jgi:hypothetical protein
LPVFDCWELPTPPVAGLGTRDPPDGVPVSGVIAVEPGVPLGTWPWVPGRTRDGGKTSELERFGVIGPLGVGVSPGEPLGARVAGDPVPGDVDPPVLPLAPPLPDDV